MKVTKAWLHKNTACADGIEWFLEQEETDAETIIHSLMDQYRQTWATWLLSKCLNKENRIKCAIHAAELVLDIFEEPFPEDKRPFLAIKSAKTCLSNPNNENRGIASTCAMDAGAASALPNCSSRSKSAIFTAYSCAASAYFINDDIIGASFAEDAITCAANSLEASLHATEHLITYGLVLLEEQEEVIGEGN